jgi:hypothetical protein
VNQGTQVAGWRRHEDDAAVSALASYSVKQNREYLHKLLNYSGPVLNLLLKEWPLKISRPSLVLRQFAQSAESHVHGALIAYPWIPKALLDSIKDCAPGSNDPLPEFLGIRFPDRCFVKRLPIGPAREAG